MITEVKNMFRDFDRCPRCNHNDAPMVWLGEGKGWLCEDCFEKERRNENANISDNHVNHMRDNSDSSIHQQ